MPGRSVRGFTLVEILVTAAILTTGLAACSILFSYSVVTNIRTQRRSSATLLLYDKLEELRSSSVWNSGEYSEHLTIAPTGEVMVTTEKTLADYLRVWSIADTVPRKATVRILESRPDPSAGFVELAVGTITAGASF